MAKNISNVNTSDTFQQWLDKTNAFASAFRTDVVTTGSGDTAGQGNAQITGNFTAAAFLGDVQTDAISAETSSAVIQVNSPFKVNGASQTTATFSNGTGGQVEFTNGSLTWDVGLKDSGGNFLINTGAGDSKFELSSAGTLTVPNITVTEDISANNFIGDGSQLTGVISSVALDDISDITLTNVQGGQVLKYNSSAGAWVNDTDFDGGSNVNAATLDNLDSTQFLRSDANDTYTGDLTVSGAINQTGNMAIDGALTVTGDITTNYSASDERLKENLKVIEQPLEKINAISGYTFNYKDKPRETVPGVIAQEVEKVLPNVVFDHERDGGTYKAVRYDQLIPLLIESIKELNEKVNDLQNELNS
jgi:hypothetical protein